MGYWLTLARAGILGCKAQARCERQTGTGTGEKTNHTVPAMPDVVTQQVRGVAAVRKSNSRSAQETEESRVRLRCIRSYRLKPPCDPFPETTLFKRAGGLLQPGCGLWQLGAGRMILIELDSHLPMQRGYFYACFHAFLVITDQGRGVRLEVLSLPAIEIALVFILLQQLFLLRHLCLHLRSGILIVFCNGLMVAASSGILSGSANFRGVDWLGRDDRCALPRPRHQSWTTLQGHFQILFSWRQSKLSESDSILLEWMP